MKKIGKYWISALVMLIAVQTLVAQEVNFYASVDKNPVSTGDVFSLRLTLENGRGDIEAPDLSDFQVVFGPSQSSSYRIINGQQSSTVTLSYTMRPKEPGRYMIGAATARVGGKSYKTEPFSLEVLRGSASSGNVQQNSGSGSPRGQGSSTATQTDENLKVMIQVSKANVYQGEYLLVSYILFSRYNAIDLRETNFPNLSGFWTEEIKSDQTSWEDKLETINGVPYRKAILKRQVLFPQRSGELEIGPLSVTCRVNRSFFNPGTEITAQSNSLRINVKPLPGNAPESFNGAVGDYTFSVKTAGNELEANEAIDLTMTISGKGNLTLIKAPSVIFPEDFDAYDPEQKDRISVNAGGVSGSRTYQYLVIPRYPGKYEIPALSFSWFDPVKERYFTETKGPLEFAVSGENGLVPEDGAPRAQNRVEQTRNDIRYIITDSKEFVKNGHGFFGGFGYYIALSAPVLLFLGFVVLSKRQKSLQSDVSGNRKRKANKVALKRLSTAEKAMNENDSTLFYAEIFSALYGYLGDKLGIPASNLSRPMLKQKMVDAGIEEEVSYEALRIIETCEMARFAPVTEQSDFSFYKRAVGLIEKLEGSIK